jgi:nucleoid-associated protein YgaU
MRSVAKRNIWPKVGLVIGLLGVSAASCFAQSLGEVARQQRTRKQARPAEKLHVYTNEDLSRKQILLPQDAARFQAERRDSHLAAPQQATGNLAVAPSPEEIPLGDVARYYRLQKQLKEKRLAGELPGIAGPAPLAAPNTPLLPATSVRAPVAKPARRPSLPADKPTVRRPPRNPAESVRVVRGDSLWKLAERYLGSGLRWPELAELNPQIPNPSLIHVGELIRLPLPTSATEVAKTFRVSRGDSLWKVASRELGSGAAWVCIAQANPRIENPDLIYPGQTLAIPARCTPATVSRLATNWIAGTNPKR